MLHYHLFFSSYNSVNPIVGHLARWLKYSQSFSGDVAQVDISIYTLGRKRSRKNAGKDLNTTNGAPNNGAPHFIGSRHWWLGVYITTSTPPFLNK